MAKMERFEESFRCFCGKGAVVRITEELDQAFVSPWQRAQWAEVDCSTCAPVWRFRVELGEQLVGYRLDSSEQEPHPLPMTRI